MKRDYPTFEQIDRVLTVVALAIGAALIVGTLIAVPDIWIVLRQIIRGVAPFAAVITLGLLIAQHWNKNDH